MDALLWTLVAAALALVLLAIVGWWLLRRLTRTPQPLVRRMVKLSWRAKAKLALALLRDPRLPLAPRLLIPAVVLYLALPLDIIPDFIPVLGQLDDVLILLVALRLVLRSIPEPLLEEHISRLEQLHSNLPASEEPIR